MKALNPISRSIAPAILFLALAAVVVAWAGLPSGLGGSGRVQKTTVGTRPGNVGHGTPLAPGHGNQLAIFAQGCFWGSENRFRKIPGVVATAAGYVGGSQSNPTYDDVSSHVTGHAEAVLMEFDPKKLSYRELLAIFWGSHDPTTRDRQGPDFGSNYRSAIFTLDSEQLKAALASRDEEQKHLTNPITTQIVPAGPFWIAEDYHQQYDEKQGYESCPVPHHAQRKP